MKLTLLDDSMNISLHNFKTCTAKEHYHYWKGETTHTWFKKVQYSSAIYENIPNTCYVMQCYVTINVFIQLVLLTASDPCMVILNSFTGLEPK